MVIHSNLSKCSELDRIRSNIKALEDHIAEKQRVLASYKLELADLLVEEQSWSQYGPRIEFTKRGNT